MDPKIKPFEPDAVHAVPVAVLKQLITLLPGVVCITPEVVVPLSVIDGIMKVCWKFVPDFAVSGSVNVKVVALDVPLANLIQHVHLLPIVMYLAAITVGFAENPVNVGVQSDHVGLVAFTV